MIHPQTELRLANPAIGYGVFATTSIPRGTLVYVQDELEIVIPPDHYRRLPHLLRAPIDRYSFIDARGRRIVSWDIAKYVNHCCACNTMSTGYGFEIAIRDIDAGEEITDEYGMFNLPEPMDVSCGCEGCRLTIRATDLDEYADQWDDHVRSAIELVRDVAQPLWDLVDIGTQLELIECLNGNRQYRSVRELRLEIRKDDSFSEQSFRVIPETSFRKRTGNSPSGAVTRRS